MKLAEIADKLTSLDDAKRITRELVAINQSLQDEIDILKTAIESL